MLLHSEFVQYISLLSCCVYYFVCHHQLLTNSQSWYIRPFHIKPLWMLASLILLLLSPSFLTIRHNSSFQKCMLHPRWAAFLTVTKWGILLYTKNAAKIWPDLKDVTAVSFTALSYLLFTALLRCEQKNSTTKIGWKMTLFLWRNEKAHKPCLSVIMWRSGVISTQSLVKHVTNSLLRRTCPTATAAYTLEHR